MTDSVMIGGNALRARPNGDGTHSLETSGSVPVAGSAVILALQTANPGTGWATFAAQACTALDLVNNSGTTIEYRRGGTGAAMPIPTGTARMIIGITNANEISIRRVDQSNTQVTIQAEAFTA